MLVHRLVKARHAATALDGEGARRVGGRWNAPGVPVAYCASSLSLAVLELLVHVDPADVPDDLALHFDVPDDLAVRRLLQAELPGDWRRGSGKAALRALGMAWIQARIEAILIVPSIIVPTELDVLVNARHPDAARVQVLTREPFNLDSRLL